LTPVAAARSAFSRLKFMGAYLLYAASLAAAMAAGDFSLAQAHAEDLGVPYGGEITAGGAPNLPPRRFSGFDRAGLWAAPEKGTAEGNLGLEGRKPIGSVGPPGLPAQGPGVAPKSGVAEAKRLTLAPKPAPEAMRKQMLDALFVRLRNAGDPGDAQRIAASIERVWLQSDSDTADLLMQRATVSMQARQYPLALLLFDKLVALEPDWAEAWNQRATTRFLAGDTDGAMADINQVMKLEPRHFGALAGVGMILQGAGLDKSALEIFKKALGIYPLEPNIQKLVEKLTLEVEGEDI
jgi:tetratricopeptide (TPR) repeat protein